MIERVACLVPGCRHTRRNDAGWSEWVCADHWRLLTRDEKRVWRRVKRWGSRMVYARVWRAMRRRVIERAMGVS
jgi:hypothetical protein